MYRKIYRITMFKNAFSECLVFIKKIVLGEKNTNFCITYRSKWFLVNLPKRNFYQYASFHILCVKIWFETQKVNYVHILSFLCFCTVQCIHNFHCCTQPGVLTWTIFRCNDEGSMNSRTHIDMFCGGITKLQLGQRYEEILWRKPYRKFSLSLCWQLRQMNASCVISSSHIISNKIQF
jgi:hypothetical protein